MIPAYHAVRIILMSDLYKMKHIGVIGIGNKFRNDDGIGVVLLENIKEKKKLLSEDITFIDGGIGGLNLLHLFSQFDIVFIIDAVNFSGEIGEMRYFSEDEIADIKDVTHYSSHEPDILQIINLFCCF